MNFKKYLLNNSKFILLILLISCLTPTVSCSKLEKNDSYKSSNVKIHKFESGNFKQSNKYKVGVGYSSNENEELAAKEVLDKISSVSNPDMLVLYASSDYKMDHVLPLIKSKYNNSVIFGASTRDEIITSDGIFKGNKGSIGMLAFESSKLKVGSAAKPFDENESKSAINEITKETIDEAVSNTKIDKGAKPKLVYMSCTGGYEEIVISAISNYFDKETKIYGGTASTSSINSNKEMPSFVIGNWDIYKKGVAILLVYEGANIGGAYKSGFINFSNDKVGTITSCDESTRTVKTIDNVPASDTYNKWSNNVFDSELIKGKLINNTKTQYLLTRKLGDSEENVLTAVIKIDPITKTIGTAANLIKGQKIHYIKANKDVLINRTGPMVTEALINGNIKKSNMIFGMFNICAGARRFIGSDSDEVRKKLNNELGEIPWIGFVSQGEQGTIKNYGSFHGNFMSSIVIFGN